MINETIENQHDEIKRQKENYSKQIKRQQKRELTIEEEMEYDIQFLKKTKLLIQSVPTSGHYPEKFRLKRSRVHYFLNKLYGKIIPSQPIEENELEEIAWENIDIFLIEILLRKLESCKERKNVNLKMDEFDELLHYLFENDPEDLKNKYAVVPNQYGVLKKRTDLYHDDNVPEYLKNPHIIHLGTDFEDILKHKEITIEITKMNLEGAIDKFASNCNPKNFSDKTKVISYVNKNLKLESLMYLFSLLPEKQELKEQQERFVRLANIYLNVHPECMSVQIETSTLWDYYRIELMKFIIEKHNKSETIVDLMNALSIREQNEFMDVMNCYWICFEICQKQKQFEFKEHKKVLEKKPKSVPQTRTVKKERMIWNGYRDVWETYYEKEQYYTTEYYYEEVEKIQPYKLKLPNQNEKMANTETLYEDTGVPDCLKHENIKLIGTDFKQILLHKEITYKKLIKLEFNSAAEMVNTNLNTLIGDSSTTIHTNLKNGFLYLFSLIPDMKDEKERQEEFYILSRIYLDNPFNKQTIHVETNAMWERGKIEIMKLFISEHNKYSSVSSLEKTIKVRNVEGMTFIKVMNLYWKYYNYCKQNGQSLFPSTNDAFKVKMPNQNKQFKYIEELEYDNINDEDLVDVQQFLFDCTMNTEYIKNVGNRKIFDKKYKNLLMYRGIENHDNLKIVTKQYFCKYIDDMIYHYYSQKHDEAFRSSYFKQAVQLLSKNDSRNDKTLFPHFCVEATKRDIEYNVVFTEEFRKELFNTTNFMKQHGFATANELQYSFDQMKLEIEHLKQQIQQLTNGNGNRIETR